jgi:hypothetical protein
MYVCMYVYVANDRNKPQKIWNYKNLEKNSSVLKLFYRT